MRLMEYLQESINDKGIFKSCMMAGTSNSGKSWVITKITSGQIEPRIVNTDKFVEFYMDMDPGYDWLKYGDQTKKLTKAQLFNYINSLLPLWIDGTSSNPNAVLRRKGMLQSLGYDVSMIFVDTPVETAIERNKKRNRVVDEDFLVKAYEQSMQLKNYYASEFKVFTEILNGEGELTDEAILNAYRKMRGFFDGPLMNPIGQNLIKELKNIGGKYLVDHSEYNMQYLKKLVENWYRK